MKLKVVKKKLIWLASIITLVVLLAPTPLILAQATPTYYVDDSADAGGDGSAGSPYQTITEALSAASADEVIEVAEGTYSWTPWSGQEIWGGWVMECSSGEGELDFTVHGVRIQATKEGTGTPTVGAAILKDNPGGATGSDRNVYFDFYLSDDTNIDGCAAIATIPNSLLRLLNTSTVTAYWYNGSVWAECSDYSFDEATGQLTITIDTTTTPSLSQLTGTPLGGGGDDSAATTLLRNLLPLTVAIAVVLITLNTIFKGGVSWTGLILPLAIGILAFFMLRSMIDALL